ncbi:MAG: hypothetical protein AB7S75_18250 [Desulfococcaceae bacterium]
MHEYSAQDLANLYQNPFAALSLERAKDDFRDFFPTREKFSEAAKHLESEFIVYARLCKLVGDQQAKSLVSSATQITWRALSVDKNETMKVLSRAAFDSDMATTTFWSLLKRYPDMPWRNENSLSRDRVSEILAFSAEIIEGVLKREMWSKLALRDIANKSTKNPLRWQSEILGNIVSSASSLPNPLGKFIGQDPLPNITLNQFRNIGAHKDFSVVRNVITLFPSTEKIVVTMQDLENALEIIGRVRIPLRLSNTISNLNDIEGLISAGYKPNDTPEAVAVVLTTSLGANGITLKNVRHSNQDIEINCQATREFDDENLLFLVLRKIGSFIYVYQNTFEHTASSKIRIAISKIDGETMEVSGNIDETLSYLNSKGYTEIPFELTEKGITGIVKLKVDVGEKPIKLG